MSVRMDRDNHLPHYRNSDSAMVVVALIIIGFMSFVFGALIGGLVVWIL
jgi:uncharacterized Tic20 family protein